jgi:hypothetical protein
VHKAPGGLVRVTLMVASGTVAEALVSGDFYAIGDAPAVIQNALLGSADPDAMRRRLEAVWPELETPGVAAADVAEAAAQALIPSPQPVGVGTQG